MMSATQRTTTLIFATGAGAGYCPWFPGTAGTLVAIPLSLGLNSLALRSLPLSLLTLAAFIVCAVWFSAQGEQILEQKDSGKIVIDEIAGFLVANYFAPAALLPVVCAFILFRFFDIIKVYPAGKLEMIPGGPGIVLDDLVAGLYTFFIVRLLLLWGLL